MWASVVDQLVGTCADVTTVITNNTADPHDFEPTAETSATFADAQLVVMNGLGYDSWANKIIGSLGILRPRYSMWDCRWFGARRQPAHLVLAGLRHQGRCGRHGGGQACRCPASSYFDDQAATFAKALKPYFDKVESIKQKYSGTKIAATETVFNYMAAATGLIITTPPGFTAAVATDSEPTTRDVALFREQLSTGVDKVLIYNSQTEGALPSQMRDVAQANNVPVVPITESLNPPDSTFQAWQIAQLDALTTALG